MDLYIAWSSQSLVFAQILFAVIFTFARMGCGSYITYLTVAADNPFVIKVRCSVLYRGKYKFNSSVNQKKKNHSFVNLFCLAVTSSNYSWAFTTLFRQWHWACFWLVPSGSTKSLQWWTTNWWRGLIKMSPKSYLNPKI